MENEMTNPAVIMLINMTIVFAVLALLNLFIRLIHFIDPTKEKKAPAAAPKAAPRKAAPAKAAAPAPVVVHWQPMVLVFLKSELFVLQQETAGLGQLVLMV